MISTLESLYFAVPRFGHATKTNCEKLQTVNPETY